MIGNTIMNDIINLAKKYVAAKESVSMVNEALDLAKKHKKEMEEELLTAMIDSGIPSIRIDDIGLLSLKTENYLSVNKASEFEFYEYLKQTGNGGLLKEYCDARTLKVFLNPHLEELKSEYINSGLDELQARDQALDFLKSKGVSYFTDKSISLRKA